MATDTLPANLVTAKPYPNSRHPIEISPEDMPEHYASICRGDCLEPVFSDGACLVFSTAERAVAGDFVGFGFIPTPLGKMNCHDGSSASTWACQPILLCLISQTWATKSSRLLSSSSLILPSSCRFARHACSQSTR